MIKIPLPQFNSIRFKMSVLYVVILGIILMVYSAILYFSLRYLLYHDLDGELEAKAREVGAIIQAYSQTLGQDQISFLSAVGQTIRLEKEGPDQESFSPAEARWLQNIDRYDLRRDFISVLKVDGTPLLASNDLNPRLLRFFVKVYRSGPQGEFFFKNVRSGRRDLRIVNLPYEFEAHGTYVIQIGTSIKSTIYLLKSRLIQIVVSIPLILLLTSFIGRIFALRILKPVLEITKTAEKITHEDLSARVQAKHADEEIKYLVRAFNEMISRLEKSFQYIAEFSSRVAHELKTPLAIIRGEAQVALRKERSIEEYQRVIQVNLEEAERMIKVVEDLLLLAKLEYDTGVFRFEPVELVEFFKDIGERTRVLAAEKNMIVKLNLPKERIQIQGDGLHLRRLFFNLIDNALKFSPPGSAIEIGVRPNDGRVKVSVRDQGMGISEEDLPKIFEKFFHRDRRKEASGAGTGLGLSLARSIARAHQGEIEVKSELSKGSTFTVTLPLASLH